MREYKLYCIDTDGHIAKRYDIHAADDLAALDRARELCEKFEIEIWQGARMVSALPEKGRRARYRHKVRMPTKPVIAQES